MRRAPLALALAATLTAAPLAIAQNDPALAARIERIISRPEFKHALWGIEIFDADAGRPLYALNEEKLFTPGSTTKLLSAGTALAKLGATHRFTTRVYRTGPVSRDGTMKGDLVLVASGDPNLSQRIQPDGSLAFENHDHSYGGAPDTRAVPGDPLVIIKQLAAQVAAQGIKRIVGRVLVDVSLYHEGTRELGSGVVVSPISVNDNVLDVLIEPGARVGDPLRLSVSPPTRQVRSVISPKHNCAVMVMLAGFYLRQTQPALSAGLALMRLLPMLLLSAQSPLKNAASPPLQAAAWALTRRWN